MVKKLFISASLALIIGGCGGADNRDDSQVPAHEAKEKLNRSDWEAVNKPGESSLGVLSKSLDDSFLEIKLKKGDSVGKYVQFYIDSDHNEGTGYRNDWVDGADYLIEEGRVYKSTANGSTWSWERVATVAFNHANTEIYTSATDEVILELSEKFRVAAISLSNDWHIVSNILMTPIHRGVIAVDADVSDWADVPVLATSQMGSLKVTDDNKKVYFLLQNGNLGKHTQLYINSDKDINTGHKNYKLGNQSGAEYLIEDNRLYKSTANDSSWSWERVGFVTVAKDGDVLEIAVSKDEIGLENSDEFVVGAIGWNAAFDESVSYMGMQNSLTSSEKSLVINEIMAENAHTIVDPDFLQFSDWIELHNQTSNAIDISNYTLSDKLDKQKWTIPSGTVIGAGAYMMFWADGKDKVSKGFHTNFTLKGKGEAVALFDVHKNLVDGFSFGKQKPDVSSILIDGKVRYMTPTPNTKNNHAIEELILSDKPTFSVTSSFHEDAQRIELRAESGSTIYYTLDGSFPTENSSVYTGAIDIDKTKIVRARAKEAGKLLSYATTKSYFIGQETALDIISISTDDKYLFDNTMGIYTIGTNGAKTPGCSDGPSIANFYQGWKRPANLEYFKNSNKELEFSQEFDIKISGSCSRMLPQKSLSISAKKKYEKDVLEYKLFPNKDIQEVKGFKLKSAGQDWYKAMLRDAFAHQVIKDDFDVEYQDYKPVVVFLNGEYWGIHNIREKKNEDFLASNHSGVDDKKVDILKNNMSINEGSKENYEDMITYIQTHELSDNDNYNEVKTMMDVENYMDYIIAETYFGNGDWPYENVRYWREKDASPKWRWILEDLDLGLSIYGDPIDNMFELITDTSNISYKNPLWSTFLFRELIKNDTFKSRFKQKYEGYLNSTFETSRVKGILDNMASVIRGEIPRHTAKWGSGDVHTPRNIDRWEENINLLKDVIDGRADTVRNQLDAAF